MRFILFHKKRHPNELGKTDIEAFLFHLAIDRKVSASTQNQAFNAPLFLYRHVLKKEIGDNINAVRAEKPKRLPTVMTKEETVKVINALPGVHQLMAKLLYGSGLRLMECVRLRVKDTDFNRLQILVREAKGNKNRVTMLPESVLPSLKDHLIHENSLQKAVKKAAALAEIDKSISCHTFRHTKI